MPTKTAAPRIEPARLAMYLYLNRLRESGETNMFGASPYLQEEFGISKREASDTLVGWMRWVEQDEANLTK
jgi:hypothetical protein